MKKINIFNLDIGLEEKKYVNECLKSGWLSFEGKYVKKFENEFEKFIGMGFALTTSNGTTALELALSSLDIKYGDEVIISDFSFAAPINAILSVGAKPVIVDILKSSWCIDIDKILKSITKKTKAILVVHTYGIISNIEEIKKISKKKKLFLIEDCAESLGARYKSKFYGLTGDCSTYSFFPNKTITTGEGGMIVFKKKKYFEKAKVLRNQGREQNNKNFFHIMPGYNVRMSNINAAIGYAQLKKIKKYLIKRKKVFDLYDSYLKNSGLFEMMPVPKYTENSYWLYTLKIKNFSKLKRDTLILKLIHNGIETRPAFFPLSKMKAYKDYANKKNYISNQISDCVLSLPTFLNLTNNKIKKISNTLIINVKNLNKYS